jgi:hypothetical protein
MRVVYQVESRLNDLRDDGRDPSGPFGDSASPATKPQAAPGDQAKPKDGQQDDKKQGVPQGTSKFEMSAPLKGADSHTGTADEAKSAAGLDHDRMQEGA